MENFDDLGIKKVALAVLYRGKQEQTLYQNGEDSFVLETTYDDADGSGFQRTQPEMVKDIIASWNIDNPEESKRKLKTFLPSLGVKDEHLILLMEKLKGCNRQELVNEIATRFSFSKKILFVAFSHTLTEGQISSAIEDLGVERVITLREVNPELQARMSQVPAKSSLGEVKELALEILAEALLNGATHFFIAGEPTLMTWGNIFAGGMSLNPSGGFDLFRSLGGWSKKLPLKCVQSTTERISEDIPQKDGTVKKVQIFKHVAWRPMF